MNGLSNISPKLSGATLAGSLVTVGMCVAQANNIHIDPGVAAAATVLLSSLVAYFIPHQTNGQSSTTTTTTQTTKGQPPQ